MLSWKTILGYARAARTLAIIAPAAAPALRLPPAASSRFRTQRSLRLSAGSTGVEVSAGVQHTRLPRASVAAYSQPF